VRLRRRARRLRIALSPKTAEQKNARREVSLWNAIQRGHDPDLILLRDERDMLSMNYEATREVHSEWAAMARKIEPKAGGCDCDVCAISRGLRTAVTALEAAA
jgi:branched-subunit amino acid aminotransferase/4-amino-4-deoxychorismate lyase